MSDVKGAPGKTEQHGEAKLSFIERLKHYFTELQFEWKKISFPSPKEQQQSTIVVFVFTLLVMGIISILDFAISFIFVNFILPAA